MLMALPDPVRAEMEFAGYIRTAGGTKFVLADQVQARFSDWLEVGGRFDGYVVTAFDAKTETLTLTKDGASTRLTLKSAAIKPLPATEGSEWSEATLAEELAANRKRFAAINAEVNDVFRKFSEVQGRPGSAAAAQRELMAAMAVRTAKTPLRDLLEELIQLQSDLILFIQMRREDDENAVKTRARVTDLKQKIVALDRPVASPGR